MKKTMRLFVIALMIGSFVNAQNAREAINNTKQIIEGQKMLERDEAELKTFRAKLGQLKSAVNSDDQAEIRRLKADLVTDMAREVEQSGVKAKKARIEIAQSSAEIRTDNREIRRDRNDSNNGRFDRRDDEKDLARDKANRRDDRRDRRDDIRDMQQIINNAEKQVQLLQTIRDYDFTIDTPSREAFVARKRLVKSSFMDFIDTMKADIASTKRELAEDNRERREDRRERRDDRQERNEVDSRRRIRN